MERIETFMEHKVKLNPLQDRRELQAKAERGEINPAGYWRNLRASWYQMTAKDKAAELAEIS